MKSSVNTPTIHRVGKIKLTIIMALVVILPIGALMVAVLQTRYSDVNVSLNVARANHINTSINEYLNKPIGERNVGDDVDTELLGEYVNVESDAVTIDIPQEVESYLDARVVEYIAELETVANQAYVELLEAIDTIDWDNIDAIDLPNSRALGLHIETWIVRAGIDTALAIVNGAIYAVKNLPFIGKKTAIKAMRKALPAGLQLLKTLFVSLAPVVNQITSFLERATDNQLWTWFSIGGIVGNCIDMWDIDGLNGWITF